MISIFKTFTFDSAHFLPNVPNEHKCRNMHGHTYHLKLVIAGHLKQHEGWVMDFGDIKTIVDPVLKTVDHKVLNEIPGLENPTCETFCIWWYNQLKPHIPGLHTVELNETPTSGATYSPTAWQSS